MQLTPKTDRHNIIIRSGGEYTYYHYYYYYYICVEVVESSVFVQKWLKHMI